MYSIYGDLESEGNMNNYVITIGRQAGSGGSILGRNLAKHFGFHYIDKDLIKKAAEELNVPEEELARMDEKESIAGRLLLQTGGYPMAYMSEDWKTSTGEDVFKTESKLIRQAAEQASCVVVGRCGSFLFTGYEKHISLFLYAEEEARARRLGGHLGMADEKTIKMIRKLDKERARYVRTYTGQEWQDPTSYDLTIDTEKLDDQQLMDVAIHYICCRFPELKK